MDYLDYLPHTDYDQLPPEVQASISRETYVNRQRLALALAAPTANDLPPNLSRAFNEQKAATPKLKLSSKRHPWLAAAGWLLFLVTGALLFQTMGNERTVYQLVSAPVLPAEVIHDTIVETVTEQVFVTRYDTVVRYRDPVTEPIQYVYLTDTVYLPNQAQFVSDSIDSSRPAARNLRYLDLLIETE